MGEMYVGPRLEPYRVRFDFKAPVVRDGFAMPYWQTRVSAVDWCHAITLAAGEAPHQLSLPVLESLLRGAYTVERP